MADQRWIAIATYADRISAEAVLGLIGGGQLPCYIASNEHVPGLGFAFSVMVPAPLARQAEWLLEQSRVSERELTYLATGELDAPEEP